MWCSVERRISEKREKGQMIDFRRIKKATVRELVCTKNVHSGRL